MSDHTCPYSWCRSSSSTCAEEHYGDNQIVTKHEHVTITCDAWVVATERVDDEIWLFLQKDASDDGTGTSLTIVEAMELRRLIDVALVHRSEVIDGLRQTHPTTAAAQP